MKNYAFPILMVILFTFSCSYAPSHKHKIPERQIASDELERLFSLDDLADAIHAIWQRTTAHPERFKPVVFNGNKITTEDMSLEEYWRQFYREDRFPEAFENGELKDVFKNAYRVNPETGALEVNIVPLANRYLGGFGAENSRAASVAMLSLDEILAAVDLNDEADTQKLLVEWLEFIHQKWLDANSWAAGNPLYSPAWVDLNPDMQQADLNQLQAAFKKYQDAVRKMYRETGSDAWAMEVQRAEALMAELRKIQNRVQMTTRISKAVHLKFKTTSYDSFFRPIIHKGEPLSEEALEDYLDQVNVRNRGHLRLVDGVWYEDVLRLPFEQLSPEYRARVEFLANQTLNVFEAYPLYSIGSDSQEARIFMDEVLNQVTRLYLDQEMISNQTMLLADKYEDLPHSEQKRILATVATAAREKFKRSDEPGPAILRAVQDFEMKLDKTEAIAKRLHEKIRGQSVASTHFREVTSAGGKPVPYSEKTEYMRIRNIPGRFVDFFVEGNTGELREDVNRIPFEHLSDVNRQYFEASAKLASRVLDDRFQNTEAELERRAMALARNLDQYQERTRDLSALQREFSKRVDELRGQGSSEVVQSEVDRYVRDSLEELKNRWVEIGEVDSSLPYFRKSWNKLPPDFQRETLMVLRATIEEKYSNLTSDEVHLQMRKTLKQLELEVEDVTNLADRLHESWQGNVDRAARPEVYKAMTDYQGKLVSEADLDNFLAKQNIPDRYRPYYRVVDGRVEENILEIPNRHLSPGNKLANDLGALDAMEMLKKRFSDLESLRRLSPLELEKVFKDATDDINRSWLEWNPERRGQRTDNGGLTYDLNFDQRPQEVNRYNLGTVKVALTEFLENQPGEGQFLIRALGGFMGEATEGPSCMQLAADVVRH